MNDNMFEALVRQMNKLMISSRSPFIEQHEDSRGNVNWLQHNYTLTDNIVRSHVMGERTVGIFYANKAKATKFLVFDIDAEGDAEGQEIRLKAIVHALKQAGIDDQDIHVMFSGMKGFHVQLFWDEPLKINSVVAFGRSIIHQLGDYSLGVELRPESVSGRGVKLPLAYHKKSGMNAMYVDNYTLQPVPDSMEYFLAIQQMDTNIMLAAIDRSLKAERTRLAERFAAKSLDEFGLETVDQRIQRAELDFAAMKMPVNKKSGLREKVEKLIRDGLSSKGTRHSSQFLVALYCKDSNMPLDQAITFVNDWITVQWQKGTTNEKDLKFLHKEAERCVRYVYGRDDYIGLNDSRGRKPEMTSQDVLFAARFKNENVRKVIWAFLMIGRMYHESGEFFVPQGSVVQITGLSRPTVSKVTNLLIEHGFLEVVEEWSYTNQRARTYYMGHLVANSDDDSQMIQTLPEDSVSRMFQRTMRLVDRLSYDIPM